MIEVSLHDGMTLDAVTVNYLDSWTLGTEHTFVPCFFSVRDRNEAFAFVREMKVLGAYGGKTGCTLNNVHFEVIFTSDQRILPNEKRKLRGKPRVWVVKNRALGSNPFENM